MFGLVTRQELESVLKGLRAEIAKLEADREEWYDKYRRLLARLSKRASREDETSPQAAWLAKMDPTSRKVWEARLANGVLQRPG